MFLDNPCARRISSFEMTAFLLNIICGILLCIEMKLDSDIMNISDLDIFILFFGYLLVIIGKLSFSFLIVWPNNENSKNNRSFHKCWSIYQYIKPMLYFIYNIGIGIPVYNITTSIYKSNLDDFRKEEEMTFIAYYASGVFTCGILTIAFGFFWKADIKIWLYPLLCHYIVIVAFAGGYAYRHFEIGLIFPFDQDILLDEPMLPVSSQHISLNRYFSLIQIIFTFICFLSLLFAKE